MSECGSERPGGVTSPPDAHSRPYATGSDEVHRDGAAVTGACRGIVRGSGAATARGRRRHAGVTGFGEAA